MQLFTILCICIYKNSNTQQLNCECKCTYLTDCIVDKELIMKVKTMIAINNLKIPYLYSFTHRQVNTIDKIPMVTIDVMFIDLIMTQEDFLV